MAKQPRGNKKYFTAAEANAMLPLVRRVVTDIAALANELSDRAERLSRMQTGTLTREHQEEFAQAAEEFERGKEQLADYEDELQRLGVHLKDRFTGLVDFSCWMDDREVFLCWKLGEPEVAHWHELDAGFAGRQKLVSVL